MYHSGGVGGYGEGERATHECGIKNDHKIKILLCGNAFIFGFEFISKPTKEDLE